VRLIVLGAAAGGGFPQWNCNCANCRRARAGDPAALPRTQSSLALSADGERWVLLNASPDLRQQIASSPALHPKGAARHSPIAAVALTSGDIDHVAGLLTMRESQPFSLYAAERVHAALRANSIFNALGAAVARRTLALDRAEDLGDRDGNALGLRLTPFAVPGKIALYLEDPKAGADFGTQAGDTIALEIAAGGRDRVYYIPACAEFPPALAKRIDGARTVFFDGTLWDDGEMVAAGLGQKSGRRMGHMSMAGAGGTIAAFSALAVGRKIFVHINNTNPVLLDDSAERAMAEKAGWEIACDGMEIDL
jgi:pyrroloquinoline quinone biosynthesis protein B